MTTLRRISQVITDLKSLNVITAEDTIENVIYQKCSMCLEIHFEETFANDYHTNRVTTILRAFAEEFSSQQVFAYAAEISQKIEICKIEIPFSL